MVKNLLFNQQISSVQQKGPVKPLASVSYQREIQGKTFWLTVLAAANTSNLHVDMETEPSEM